MTRVPVRVETCGHVQPESTKPPYVVTRRCEKPKGHRGGHRAICDWCDGYGNEDGCEAICGVCSGLGIIWWAEEAKEAAKP